jgi:hypothetical protein
VTTDQRKRLRIFGYVLLVRFLSSKMFSKFKHHLYWGLSYIFFCLRIFYSKILISNFQNILIFRVIIETHKSRSCLLFLWFNIFWFFVQKNFWQLFWKQTQKTKYNMSNIYDYQRWHTSSLCTKMLKKVGLSPPLTLWLMHIVCNFMVERKLNWLHWELRDSKGVLLFLDLSWFMILMNQWDDWSPRNVNSK